ncbi:hypothetical protein D3C73_278320 [compost metagenome]
MKDGQANITPAVVLIFFVVLMLITAALWFIPERTRRLFILLEFFIMLYSVSKAS